METTKKEKGKINCNICFLEGGSKMLKLPYFRKMCLNRATFPHCPESKNAILLSFLKSLPK